MMKSVGKQFEQAVTLLFLLALLLPQSAYSKDAQEIIFIASPAAHACLRIHPETQLAVTPSMLVLHYTGVTLAKTLSIFLGHGPLPTASHYTVSEDGIVFQHVAENMAARHAGVSYWRGMHTLNVHSIGIENVNAGYRQGNDMLPGIRRVGSDKEWYLFSPEQIAISIELCKESSARYGINPRNVVGHSDVAPGRKIDPGPLFPWQELAQQGIGAWPDFNKSWLLPCLSQAQQDTTLHAWLMQHLALWGYKTADATTSEQDIIQTFQMHFRQCDISGTADDESALILNALICTYLVADDGCCPCKNLCKNT